MLEAVIFGIFTGVMFFNQMWAVSTDETVSSAMCDLILTTERWGAGVVICLERGADLYMAQQIPLPLAVSCFSKIQIGFTFLVPASPGQKAVKRVFLTVLLMCLLLNFLIQRN